MRPPEQRRDEPPSVPSAGPTPDGYSSAPDFLALPGMTYRKLDYWSRIGVLRPANPAPGSGAKRLWPRDELGVCAAVLRLCAIGLDLHTAAVVSRGPRPAPGAFEVVAQPVPGVRFVVTDELWHVP